MPLEQTEVIAEPVAVLAEKPTAEVATQEDSEAAPREGGPSPRQITAARRWNRANGDYCAAFNAATDNDCIGADGDIDPVAVWFWQIDHGVKHDGMVGPVTTGAAKALATAPTPDSTPTPDAPPPPVAVVETAPPVVETAPTTETPPAVIEAPDPAPQAEPAVTESAAPTSTGGGGGGGEVMPDIAEAAPVQEAPKPPARPDNGGPGSRARRVLANNGTADQAFMHLVNDNDAVLDKNLADYGNVGEQRALLDGVISGSTDVSRVQRAFHAYWRVEVAGSGVGGSPGHHWPVGTLKAMHTQLKALPDGDARNGVWKKLSLNDAEYNKGRGWWNPNSGTFSLGSDRREATGEMMGTGYFERLSHVSAAGSTTLYVTGGERFKPGDRVELAQGTAAYEVATISAAAGHQYTVAQPLKFAHQKNDSMDLVGSHGLRETNWLGYTVRHEIAHALDGGPVDTKSLYQKAGWEVFPQGSGGVTSWLGAMGGDAWKTNDGSKLTEAQRNSITAALSFVGMFGGTLDRTSQKEEIEQLKGKDIPALRLGDYALRQNDGFIQQPTDMIAANGKRFSYSKMYQRFQHCNESALDDRVTNYSLAAPAEFFADMYAVYYEEAGKPGVTEADYGRLIRNQEWRDWMRDHVHNRGLGPADAGAGDAKTGSATRGKASGNPGQ